MTDLVEHRLYAMRICTLYKGPDQGCQSQKDGEPTRLCRPDVENGYQLCLMRRLETFPDVSNYVP